MKKASAIAEHPMSSGPLAASTVATALGATSGILTGLAGAAALGEGSVAEVVGLGVRAAVTGLGAGYIVNRGMELNHRELPLIGGVAGAFVAGAVGSIVSNATTAGVEFAPTELVLLGVMAGVGGIAAVAGLAHAGLDDNVAFSHG